ncbi:MAG: SigB/SigF/SigG family RNA polymerase sigma factor [Actinomycetota bacterium]|nr:SigB/SigF/SigG family RNA polymerase sigma factor [Actinomycetota bacterium]
MIEPATREQDELVRKYLPLARNLAGRYRNTSEPQDDLVQVAALGLVLAARRFDPERGTPFVSFAVPTILGELRRHLRDHGWAVRVPRGLQEDYMRVAAARDELGGSLGRAPTPRELADHLGMSVEAVLEATEAGAAYETGSLDGAPGGDEESQPVLASVNEPGYALVEYGVSVRPAWAQLSEHQRAAVKLRFVDDLTQSEIAARIGVSQMQVSRLLRQALDRLRSAAGEDLPTAA